MVVTTEELCPCQRRVEKPYPHYICENPEYLTRIGIDRPRISEACKNWRNCPLLKNREDKEKLLILPK